MGTMTFTGELTIHTCWCGIVHAVPQSLYDHQQQEKSAGRNMSIYCPLGHQWITAESEASKLRKKLADAEARTLREQQSHDQTRAELRETEKRRQAQKSVTTRIKNRIQAGTCPCCNRTFQNLTRHMAGQHPTYAAAE